MADMGLSGKAVIITGAASGMGRAMTHGFVSNGARVFAIDRDAEGLAATALATAGLAGEIDLAVADLANRAATETLIDHAAARFGPPDVLINNAGIMDRFQGVADVEDEIWERAMAINLDAPMRLTRKALRLMLARGHGVIINVVSTSGYSGGSAGAAYTASKHALLGLTRSTAWTYATRGIRCNAILPGSTITNISRSIDGPISATDLERYSLVHALTPVRLAAEDIAELALFLASDRAKRINGAEIAADGGLFSL
jgi:NAD(P)-dependent dehydrogenase (short-subunit alcohol dehydrogenase family)